MRILVTGAGGFIGSHMVDFCKDAGHYVIGIDKKSFEMWTRGDTEADEEHYVPVEDGIVKGMQFDVCFHLAAESRIQPSFRYPLLYMKSNVMATAAVLDQAAKCGGSVVYAGSSTADDDITKNVYAATKHHGEELCKTWYNCFGVRTAYARFYNVYGPREIMEGEYATVIGIFRRQMEEGVPLTVTGDGSQRRDFTHVDDIVKGLYGIAFLGELDGRGYALGSGRNYSIKEVAELFDSPQGYRLVPRPRGESEVTLADVSQTTKETGWRPREQLVDYIKKVTDACKEVCQ